MKILLWIGLVLVVVAGLGWSSNVVTAKSLQKQYSEEDLVPVTLGYGTGWGPQLKPPQGHLQAQVWIPFVIKVSYSMADGDDLEDHRQAWYPNVFGMVFE